MSMGMDANIFIKYAPTPPVYSICISSPRGLASKQARQASKASKRGKQASSLLNGRQASGFRCMVHVQAAKPKKQGLTPRHIVDVWSWAATTIRYMTSSSFGCPVTAAMADAQTPWTTTRVEITVEPTPNQNQPNCVLSPGIQISVGRQDARDSGTHRCYL